jgi:hypothetical protein
VPGSLAGHLRELVAARAGRGRHHLDPGPWLFPGRVPDRHIDHRTISRWIASCGVMYIHRHRAGALIDLAGQLPSPVVADLIGVNIATAVQWSRLAGRPWGQYLALPPRNPSRSTDPA